MLSLMNHIENKTGVGSANLKRLNQSNNYFKSFKPIDLPKKLYSSV